MHRIMIVGAGSGGMAILKLLAHSTNLQTVAVVDIREDAPGIAAARKAGIETSSNWRDFLHYPLDMVIDVTGESVVFDDLLTAVSKNTILIPGGIAAIIVQLLQEKEYYIQKLQNFSRRQQIIFNSIEEGMVSVNPEGVITFFNQSAARMTEVSIEDAIGKHFTTVIHDRGIERVMETGIAETNQEFLLETGKRLVTSRIPMIDENSQQIGVLAIFKDISEVVALAEEITDLKEIKTMLEAIIQSSDDAISVVDEKGRGIVVNPAYTRITGLSPEEIIGQPATTDISEGESMHLKVIETKKPIRGVNMRLGPHKREVIVNVAPIIVEEKLKGSVGVIHDVTEMRRLANELNQAKTIIRTLESKYVFDDIIGDSDEMKLAVEQAKLAAKTPVTVFLRGESGTGKELFAHAIHSESNRHYEKFIRVNCAAIAENLLESELFGYEDGAFTGAKKGGKRGLFEEANKGSIFLDEIGELSLSTQAKLLRVLQEKEIVRVGGSKPIPIDVRIIAATNVNMEKALHDHTFREDLYYRLNRMPIYIPPLRKRLEDIPQLVERLLSKLNREYGRNVTSITPTVLQRLKSYRWPGNVRELENVIGRAMIYMPINETELHERYLHISTNQKDLDEKRIANELNVEGTLEERINHFEKQIIYQALESCQHNKTKTAKILNISLRSLYYKLEKYELA
ncbi:sigma 54-interacting transcriptional regulator [Rummeliibacillus pycnus]|uniref:sigma 54-interacting transcriptional regulator n=1 Tax=Rummeliibacillus pycnus TaxID=101070 RepID=UPI0037C581FE